MPMITTKKWQRVVILLIHLPVRTLKGMLISTAMQPSMFTSNGTQRTSHHHVLILDGEGGEGVTCRESRAKEVPLRDGNVKGHPGRSCSQRKPFPDRLGNENIRYREGQ